MSDWQDLNIGSICIKIIDYRGKTPEKVLSGTKLITSKVIKNSRILDNANFEYIRDDKYEEVMRRGKPEFQDILLTTEAPLGEVALIKSDEKIAIAQRIILLRADQDKVIPDFLFYSLRGPIGYNRVQQKGTGTTVLGIKNPELKKVILPIPPLPTQQKIAKILSNHDDLIENNLKRIKLLEESARLTYEEWFLRFRVDGKKLEIDPESSLPFEWKRLKVNDYVDTISKGPSLNYDLGESKGVQVLNQSCIRNGEIELDKVLIAKELNDNKKSSYLRINDILINSMGQGTLGRVSKNVSIDEKMIIHNCITYLRAKDIYSQYMLFYFISSHKEYFESLAQGSTGQSTLKKELVSNLLITLPDDKTINRYDLIISSAWNKIGALKKQNKLLKEARDILLPRLMTGMIDTDDMDIAV